MPNVFGQNELLADVRASNTLSADAAGRNELHVDLEAPCYGPRVVAFVTSDGGYLVTDTGVRLIGVVMDCGG